MPVLVCVCAVIKMPSLLPLLDQKVVIAVARQTIVNYQASIYSFIYLFINENTAEVGERANQIFQGRRVKLTFTYLIL